IFYPKSSPTLVGTFRNVVHVISPTRPFDLESKWLRSICTPQGNLMFYFCYKLRLRHNVY
ncbi:hypothetical protein L9F63_018627, partial [Diploptera punctata]